jgi:hypothetical protein
MSQEIAQLRDPINQSRPLRTDAYGRRVTDEAVPKFVIEREPVAAPKRTWGKPLVSEYHYPTGFAKVRDRQRWERALRLDARLLATERELACTVISHFNLSTGRCDPSYGLLALELQVSARSVLRGVQKLGRYGWLKVMRRQDGCQRTNLYRPSLPPEVTAMLDAQSDKIGAPSDKTRAPSDTAMSPKQRNSEQRSIEHSVLRTASACADAVIEDQKEAFQGSKEGGPSGRERNGGDPGKPYTSDDVELVQQALNGGDMTYAGIIDATRQPGALGDGIGIDRNVLRLILNDCMQAGLVRTERRHGKDYFWMTKDGVGLDWPLVL